MSQISGLTVRHHTREDFGLTIEFTVDQRDREQVRFSKMSGARSAQSCRGLATDISSGGLGWTSRQYVPRMCEGCVRVLRPGVDPEDRIGPEDVVFEHKVKVRRTYMEGEGPRYAVGVSFIDPMPDLGDRVEQLKSLGGSHRGATDA